MGVWEWAEAAYARPGVAEACLKLQDRHGQQVAYLLWAVWAGEAAEPRLRAAAAAALAWDTAAIRPLRQARRALKAPLAPVDDGPRQALREAVKGCELFAERTLMETLAAGGSGGAGGASALDALNAAVLAWGHPAAPEALAALSQALE